MEFFKLPHVKKIYTDLSEHIKPKINEADIIKRLIECIQLICKYDSYFDSHCDYTIEQLGSWTNNECIKYINNEPTNNEAHSINIIAAFFYCLLVEEAITSNNRQHHSKINDLLTYIKHNDQEIYSEFSLIERSIALQKTKEKIKREKAEEYTNLEQSILAATTAKENLENYIGNKETKIDSLKETIDKLLTQYNFVALTEGFSRLKNEKKEELCSVGNFLILMSIIIASPFVLEAVYVLNSDTINTQKLIYTAPAILGFEAFSIYIFRVALQNHKSIKSQLLQIDHRVSLCQFIQEYAKYAKEIRENSQTSLEKFESIIFSGIAPNDEAIPSFYDSLEPLTKIISAIKGKN